MLGKPERSKLVIKLGGSLVSVEGNDLNIDYLKKFSDFVRKISKEIPAIFIVVGGGRIVREYQKAAYSLGVKRIDDLNSIGRRLTKVNAELVRSCIGQNFAGEIIYEGGPFRWTSRVVVGAGWGHSVTSDYNAVIACDLIGTNEIIRLSNIDHIYSANPKEDKSATPLKELTWDTLEKINKMTGNEDFVPGMNVPFDPKAVSLAKKIGMKMAFIHGNKLEEVEKYLLGQEFIGTYVISSGVTD